MKFKNRPSYNIPYEKQGLIYFTCITYASQTHEMQHKILNVCMIAGKEHYKAVFAAVTTDRSMQAIAIEHNLDITWLCRLCKKFYRFF